MLIKKGSRGALVKSFQLFLIDKGLLSGVADGMAGRMTHEAIKHYQESRGLVADGIAGKNTFIKAKEEGWSSKPPSTEAQRGAAKALDISVETVQAIEAVESGGKADAIRFEPHVFLRKRPDLKGSVPYTKGPRGFSVTKEETNKAAFEHAFSLDPKVAIASTSWGLYQVMGSHLLELYQDPNDAVDSFYEAPEAVSYKLFTKWFRSSPRALVAAKEKDWESLARYYNGPGQVPYYSAALLREYKKVMA